MCILCRPSRLDDATEEAGPTTGGEGCKDFLVLQLVFRRWAHTYRHISVSSNEDEGGRRRNGRKGHDRSIHSSLPNSLSVQRHGRMDPSHTVELFLETFAGAHAQGLIDRGRAVNIA